MSNVYYVVDLNRKKFIEYLDVEIKKNCSAFVQQMNESFEKSPICDPELKDFLQKTIESHIDKLADGGCLPSVLMESLAIGTSTMGQFFWRRDNGFQSVESVETYLKEHPSCTIYDQFEKDIGWEEFKKLF